MRKLLYVAVAVSMLLTLMLVAAAPAMALAPPPDTSPATNRAHDSDTHDTGGRDWTDVSYAEQCGGIYAHVHLDHGQYSDYLKLTDYHFNIPGDQTILGIVVTVTGYATSASVIKDYSVRLVKNDNIQSTDKSLGSYWPISVGDMVHGTSTDPWGSWTPAEINAVGFGAAIEVKNYSGGTNDVRALVDCVEITVYFGAGQQQQQGGSGVSVTLNLGLNIGGDGVVSGDQGYTTPDGGATLDIPDGTQVLGSSGGPVTSIVAVAAPPWGPITVPGVPQGACLVSFAYEFTPAGATFNPPATLTIKYDPAMLSTLCPGVVLGDPPNIVIAYYDSVLGWTALLPSTVDTVNHTVSAPISHFTMFAVYAPPPAPAPSPTEAPTPVEVPVVTEAPTPTEAPVEAPVVTEAPLPTEAPIVAPSPTEAPTPAPVPATEANKTNIGVIVGPIVAVIIIALVAYWFLSRRKKAPVVK